MTAQRTFWHLTGLTHKPRDYDIASTALLYNAPGPGRAAREPAVQTPIAAWNRRHQRDCKLRADDWDAFRDPRETTYTRYTELQRDQEVYVDGLLAARSRDHDAALSPQWIELLDRVLGPLRFPVHGLQMLASYVGSIAPGSRIVIACAFQAGDELRRVQRLAQRTRQLQHVHPSFADGSRARWLGDPCWQPLRELVERMLVVYDWDEACVALNGALKPGFDALFGATLGVAARAHGDDLFAGMLGSLAADGAWHQTWSGALFEQLRGHDDNRVHIEGWLAHWQPRVRLALQPLEQLLEAAAPAPGSVTR